MKRCGHGCCCTIKQTLLRVHRGVAIDCPQLSLCAMDQRTSDVETPDRDKASSSCFWDEDHGGVVLCEDWGGDIWGSASSL